MSDRQPTAWMPIYWGDYARDTGALNALAHGAYLMLLKHLWCTERGILNDDMQLCRIACCDDIEEWRRVRPALERFFEIADGMWRHRRVERELAAARRRCESRSAIGRAGATARWKHVQPPAGDAVGITDGNASAMHRHQTTPARSTVDETAGDDGVSESGGTPSPAMPEAMPSVMPTASGRQCHPQPQPHTSLRSVSHKRAKTSLPDGWKPSSDDRRYAKAKGYDEAWIDAEIEAFRDHAIKTASRYADWDAAWRNWVQNAPKFAVSRRAVGQPAPSSSPDPHGHDRAAILAWLKPTPKVPAGIWCGHGPAPNQPGCVVSAEVLAEFADAIKTRSAEIAAAAARRNTGAGSRQPAILLPISGAPASQRAAGDADADPLAIPPFLRRGGAA